MIIHSSAETVAADIAARIATLTKLQGAETDIGATVFRGRRNVDEAMVPCSVIIEGSDTVTARPGRLPQVAVTQRYVVGAYVRCSPDNPNDAAHAAIRDIKRAIFKDGGTLMGSALRVSYRGRDIGPRADGVAVVFVTVMIDVEYVEDLMAP